MKFQPRSYTQVNFKLPRKLKCFTRASSFLGALECSHGSERLCGACLRRLDKFVCTSANQNITAAPRAGEINSVNIEQTQRSLDATLTPRCLRKWCPTWRTAAISLSNSNAAAALRREWVRIQLRFLRSPPAPLLGWWKTESWKGPKQKPHAPMKAAGYQSALDPHWADIYRPLRKLKITTLLIRNKIKDGE